MHRALGLALIAVTACAGSTTAQPAATPSPSPTPPPKTYAVMVHRAGVGEPYFVQLVGLDGQGGPWVSAKTRSEKTFFLPLSACPGGVMCYDSETANYQMPETSISATHVYFLDGETDIKSLAPDGSVASVQSIDAPPNSQVMFSVSPDDRRIAVSVVTLAKKRQAATISDRMYVEDLATGLNRVDIYTSSTLAEWPVAWHSGALVVAVGTPDLGNYDNPYGAAKYVVIDPATGQRLQSIDCSFGLLVAAGSACATGALGKQAWDGAKSTFTMPSGPTPKVVRNQMIVHLSPDGTRVAAEMITDQITGASSTTVFQDGTATAIPGDVAPQGWTDGTHLVVSSPDMVEIVDVTTGTNIEMTGLKTISSQGMPQLAGSLPANLG